MPSESAKILALMFAIGRRMRHEDERYSMLHFHTLRYIEAQGKPLMHDVAAYLCVTPPAATLLIDGLVKDGLIARLFDKKDRRAVRIALTRRGKAFLARGVRAKMGRIRGLFSTLTPKERGELAAILKKILSQT